MSKLGSQNREKEVADLKDKLRKATSTPDFDALWNYLLEMRRIKDYFEDGTFTFNDLVDEAQSLATLQNSTVNTKTRSGDTSDSEKATSMKVTFEETELSPYELERAFAESAKLAVEVISRSDVKDYLTRRTNAAGETYPSRQDFKNNETVWTNARVQKLTRKLAHDLSWTEDQVAEFLQSKKYPTFSPLIGTIETYDDANTSPKISIVASSYVSAETVHRFYLRMRKHTTGRVNQATVKSVKVLRFVLERRLQHHPERLTNDELQREWNKLHPDQTYTARGSLTKAYEKAERDIRIANQQWQQRGSSSPETN